MEVYTRFPQGADKMVQVFDWELDELIPLGLFLILGMAFKNIFMMLSGFVIMKLYVKGKHRYPNNFVFIFLYSIGFISEKGYLPGYVRTFME